MLEEEVRAARGNLAKTDENALGLCPWCRSAWASGSPRRLVGRKGSRGQVRITVASKFWTKKKSPRNKKTFPHKNVTRILLETRFWTGQSGRLKQSTSSVCAMSEISPDRNGKSKVPKCAPQCRQQWMRHFGDRRCVWKKYSWFWQSIAFGPFYP